MEEVKLSDVTDEVRKLAVAWSDAYHMGTVETMQLGMQIQHVCNMQSRIQIEKDRGELCEALPLGCADAKRVIMTRAINLD